MKPACLTDLGMWRWRGGTSSIRCNPRRIGTFLLSSSWKKHPTDPKPEHGALAVGERLIAVETEPYLWAESSCISGSSRWWHWARPVQGWQRHWEPPPETFVAIPGGWLRAPGCWGTHRVSHLPAKLTQDFLSFPARSGLNFLKAVWILIQLHHWLQTLQQDFSLCS